MIAAAPFWSEFCARTGMTGPVPPVTAFGNPGTQQDALAALVLAQRKRATAGLLAGRASRILSRMGRCARAHVF
jgi:uncharacterized protein YhfF